MKRKEYNGLTIKEKEKRDTKDTRRNTSKTEPYRTGRTRRFRQIIVDIKKRGNSW
jgi:hypothetical protein